MTLYPHLGRWASAPCQASTASGMPFCEIDDVRAGSRVSLYFFQHRPNQEGRAPREVA
jgi:hypothetical protein